jgi:hypothetical protein
MTRHKRSILKMMSPSRFARAFFDITSASIPSQENTFACSDAGPIQNIGAAGVLPDCRRRSCQARARRDT